MILATRIRKLEFGGPDVTIHLVTCKNQKGRIPMRTQIGLVTAIFILSTGASAAQTLRLDRDGGFSFKFGRDDRRGDVEGKRASCEVYARVAQVQADANKRFRCGLRGPAWESDLKPHFQWCRFVPRQRIAEEQRNRSQDLQRCFDKLGDFDEDDRRGRR
jgi:hypothetical protein